MSAACTFDRDWLLSLVRLAAACKSEALSALRGEREVAASCSEEGYSDESRADAKRAASAIREVLDTRECGDMGPVRKAGRLLCALFGLPTGREPVQWLPLLKTRMPLGDVIQEVLVGVILEDQRCADYWDALMQYLFRCVAELRISPPTVISFALMAYRLASTQRSGRGYGWGNAPVYDLRGYTEMLRYPGPVLRLGSSDRRKWIDDRLLGPLTFDYVPGALDKWARSFILERLIRPDGALARVIIKRYARG